MECDNFSTFSRAPLLEIAFIDLDFTNLLYNNRFLPANLMFVAQISAMTNRDIQSCVASRSRALASGLVVIRYLTRLETISDIIRVRETTAAKAFYLGMAGIFIMPGDIVCADPVEDTTSICIVKSVPGTRPGPPRRKAEMDEKI